MKIYSSANKQTGLTLIEVLLVIAILAILAAVTIVAINPSKQLAKSRDASRTTDVYSILSSLHQYAADHDDTFPEEITTESREICRTESEDCTGLYDLSALTDNTDYLVSMPTDPRCSLGTIYCSDNGTGYFLELTASGRITVSASTTELEDSISITR